MDERSKPRRAASHRDYSDVRAKTSPGTPVSAVPLAIEDFDEGPTPLPTSAEEAFGWQHVDRRLVAVEAAVNGYTRQVDRHEQTIEQWSVTAQRCIVDIGVASQRLTGIETNLGHDSKRISDALDGVSKALRDLGDRVTRVEVAVGNISNAQIEQAAKTSALTDRVSNLELAERDKVVEARQRRRWLSWGRAAYAVVVAVIGIAGYLAGTNL